MAQDHSECLDVLIAATEKAFQPQVCDNVCSFLT